MNKPTYGYFIQNIAAGYTSSTALGQSSMRFSVFRSHKRIRFLHEKLATSISNFASVKLQAWYIHTRTDKRIMTEIDNKIGRLATAK